ncbi:hypothetical protein RGL65_001203 [Vibrio parahaemolyticus]|nr:hypothetical protein [Vibrio parahaemolyticus]
MYQLIEVVSDKPTCFVLDANGRMQAVFKALKQFISRELNVDFDKVVESGLFSKVHSTLRPLNKFYPSTVNTSEMENLFVFSTNVDGSKGCNAIVAPNEYDALEVFLLSVNQIGFIPDESNYTKFQVTVLKCKPVMPALYHSFDYDSTENIMDIIYGIIAGSISSIQQRYGKDVDTNTLKSLMKADQVDTKEGFVNAFIPVISGYQESIAAQLLYCDYKVHINEEGFEKMRKPSDFR